MTDQHLNPEQMDLLLLEGSSAAGQAASLHLEACPICKAEFEALSLSLGSFRQTMTAVSENAARTRPRTNLLPVHPAWGRRPLRVTPAYFALAASLAVAAVLVPFLPRLHRTEVTPAPVTQPAVAIDEDEALLLDIDQQLDAEVPGVMEPLANPTSRRARKYDETITATRKD